MAAADRLKASAEADASTDSTEATSTDTEATVSAPEPAPAAPAPAPAPAQPEAPVGVGSQEMAAHTSKYKIMRDLLAKQPRVRIRLQEPTTVQINGYTFSIQAKVAVEVPEQVARMLEEAGII